MIRKALGTTPRRRLRRLLRRVQAPRGAGRPRADHAVGARPLPAALLGRCAGSPDCSPSRRRWRSASGRTWARCSAQMADRGPDSAGVALYRDPAPAGDDEAVALLGRPARARGPRARRGARLPRGGRASTDAAADAACSPSGPTCAWSAPAQRIEMFKEAGDPREFVVRFGLDGMSGSHGLGHTRMATESRVTTQGAHPFSTGLDLCLVHNGSLSNHNQLRRRAAPRGDRVPDRERHGGRRGLPRVAAARGRHAGGGARGLPRRPRRLLHLRGRHGRRLRGAARPDRLQARRARRDRTTGWRWPRSTARSPCCPGAEDAAVWEPEPARVYSWERAMVVTWRWPRRSRSSTWRPRRCASSTGGCTRAAPAPRWRVVHPGGAHAVAVGIDAEIEVDVEGHVGYYCAGMNQRATVRVHGNAGVGAGGEHHVGHGGGRRLRRPVVRGHRPRRPRGRARPRLGPLRHLDEGRRHRRGRRRRAHERVHGPEGGARGLRRRRRVARRLALRGAAVRARQRRLARLGLRGEGAARTSTSRSCASCSSARASTTPTRPTFRRYGSARTLYSFEVDDA